MGKSRLIPIKCPKGTYKDFFMCWVEYLRPKHNLTNREQEVFAAILRYRYELSKAIINPDILDSTCLNSSNVEKIREQLNMSPQQFNGILLQLKLAKVIIPVLKINGRTDYYKISKGYIPNIDESGHTFIILDFDYSDDPKQEDKEASS